MALVAGSVVIPGADFQLSFPMLGAIPLFGIVESQAGGSPPTNAVVAWEDGSRVTYAVSQVSSTAMLFVVTGASEPSLLGQVVDPVTGLPNPGGAFRGTVINHVGIERPDGASNGDFVIVECPSGFYMVPAMDVTPIPSA